MGGVPCNPMPLDPQSLQYRRKWAGGRFGFAGGEWSTGSLCPVLLLPLGAVPNRHLRCFTFSRSQDRAHGKGRGECSLGSTDLKGNTAPAPPPLLQPLSPRNAPHPLALCCIPPQRALRPPRNDRPPFANARHATPRGPGRGRPGIRVRDTEGRGMGHALWTRRCAPAAPAFT